MLPLTYRRWWVALSGLLVVGVSVAAVVPALFWLPRPNVSGPGFDKWLHFATFLFLTVWFVGQYPKRSYWRIALWLAAFGALIELVQRSLTYRSADFYDLAADLLGIIVGLVVAAIGAGGWSMRLENWLLRRA